MYKKTSDVYANAINVATQNGTIDTQTQEILKMMIAKRLLLTITLYKICQLVS